MDLTIERVTDLDRVFPDLAQLLEELHEYHLPLWPREFLPDWRSRWRRHLAGDDERLILLARHDGAPAGYLNASIERDPGLFRETFAHIDDAYVRPSFRRTGLGAAMLSQFEAWCDEHGVDEVRLNVVAANAVGFGFWEKSGFAPITHKMVKRLAGGAA